MAKAIDQIFEITRDATRPIPSRPMKDGILGHSLEDALQKLLEEHPELLPGTQIGSDPDDPPRFALLRREMPVGGSWSLDHLYVDQFGILTLVETKLYQNAESRRSVVGQIIEYASNAQVSWGNGNLKDKTDEYWSRKNLETSEMIKEKFGPDLDIDQLWIDIEENLNRGRIRLIIASDEIRPEVKQMIEFLNGEFRNTEVLGLELSCYAEEDDSVIIVPRIIGQTEKSKIGKGADRPNQAWTIEKLKDSYENLDNQTLKKRLLGLLDFALKNRVFLEGRGINPTFGITRKSKDRIFTIHSNKQIYVYLEKKRFKDSPDDREELTRRLKELGLIRQDVNLDEVVSGREFLRDLDEMDQSELDRFMKLVEDICVG